jgi:hypothetical protein
MATRLFAIVGLAGCQIATPAPNESSTPWPRSMSGLVASDEPSLAASRRLHQYSPRDEEDCGAGAYQAVELVADVALTPGAETILASYANGVVVLDREGHLVASAPGYRCDGSVDEVEALAAGSAFGDTTIIVVAKTGGHRELSTFVGLFRIGFDKRLDPVFTATVEEHAGSTVRRGAIYMLPDALIYRLPDGRYAFYVFDPVGRIYLDPRDPLDDPAHEPPIEYPRSFSRENT